MLTIIYGNDDQARRQSYENVRTEYESAGRMIQVIDVGEDSFSSLQAEIEGVPLFGDKPVYLLRDVLDDPATFSFLFETTQDCICIEDHLLAPLKKKLAKHPSCILYSCEKKKEETRNRAFAITDPFKKRDPKRLWLVYQELLREGISSHALLGILWWQIKTLLQQSSKNYSPDVLRVKGQDLLDVYHYGHRDGDFDSRLEEFILTIHE